MATQTAATQQPHLKRVLSLWDLVYYGIILTSPIAAVPLFGEAQVLSHGHAVTALLVALGVAASFAVLWLRLSLAAAAAVALLGIWLWGSVAAFSEALVLPLMSGAAVVVLAFGAGLAYRFGVTDRNRRRIFKVETFRLRHDFVGLGDRVFGIPAVALQADVTVNRDAFLKIWHVTADFFDRSGNFAAGRTPRRRRAKPRRLPQLTVSWRYCDRAVPWKSRPDAVRFEC